MLKFQTREKAKLVKASTSDENVKINVEDISEVKELKGKEVEDLRVIMRKAEVEKINEENIVLCVINCVSCC